MQLLEPEERARLQTAIIAIMEEAKATVGLDEEYLRKMLLEHGFEIVPTESAVRH